MFGKSTTDLLLKTERKRERECVCKNLQEKVKRSRCAANVGSARRGRPAGSRQAPHDTDSIFVSSLSPCHPILRRVNFFEAVAALQNRFEPLLSAITQAISAFIGRQFRLETRNADDEVRTNAIHHREYGILIFTGAEEKTYQPEECNKRFKECVA